MTIWQITSLLDDKIDWHPNDLYLAVGVNSQVMDVGLQLEPKGGV